MVSPSAAAAHFGEYWSRHPNGRTDVSSDLEHGPRAERLRFATLRTGESAERFGIED